MIPERATGDRQSALPAPELVSLIEGTRTPYRAVQGGWWYRSGGALNLPAEPYVFPPCVACSLRGVA